VTIACRHYALAKCVEWGYIPWKNATSCNVTNGEKSCEVVSLRDYHQTCTRMCRADYCGDGQGWTADGTLIDIWDNLSPPIQARAAPEWPVEAEWNIDGAVCVHGTRLTHWMKEGEPQCVNKPNLWDHTTTCGSEVGIRSMLGTSYPPPAPASQSSSSSSSSSNSSSSDLVKIVTPSVVVPVFVIFAGIGILLFLRSRKRIESAKSLDSPSQTVVSLRLSSGEVTPSTNKTTSNV